MPHSPEKPENLIFPMCHNKIQGVLGTTLSNMILLTF